MGTLAEYAQLSAHVYGGNTAPPLPPGWFPVLMPDANPAQSWGSHGYHGAAYQNPRTGEVVLVSCGTDERADLPSGRALLNGNVPTQLDEARSFLNLLTREFGIPMERITFTGHSLGGSLSQILSASTLRPAVTFNAVPVKLVLPKLGLDPEGSYPITDVVDENDEIGHAGPPVGTRITLPANDLPWLGVMVPMGELAGLTALGLTFWSAHRIAGISAKLRAAEALQTPLVLDLDRDGVETVGVGAEAYFDHAGDGFAERTGWVGRDDGLLVMDRNANGIIDSGRELFGGHTLLANGSPAADGYQALAELDRNADGWVNAKDPGFAALKIWKDADGDGQSQPGELRTLADMGVAAIGVSHAPSDRIDAQGNAHRQTGTFVRSDGTMGATADVWFATDPVQSIATEWLSVPARIAALPEAVGYGTVRDLSQAATRDPGLESLLATFASQTDRRARDATFEQILFRWTGCDGLDPASRGGFIDARHLAVLEKFSGQPFVGFNGPWPNRVAAPVLEAAYHDLAEMVYAQITMTSNLRGLYNLMTFSWDDGASTMRGDLTGVIAELDRRLASDPLGGGDLLADFARSLRGFQLDGIVDYRGFHDHFSTLSEDLAWAVDSGGRTLIEGTSGADSLTGGGAGDALRGGAGADQLSGEAGDDLLFGGAGDDRLLGGPGADVLEGGAGSDWLDGGAGDDTYVLRRGSGQDVISDRDWATPNLDTIAVQATIAPADVTVRRVGDDLVLRVAGTTDELRLLGWFLEGFGSDFQVQRVTFTEGTVWDVATLKAKALAGTPGPDILVGYSSADRIEGLEGDDTLIGVGGDDRLDGGPGADNLQGGTGNDTLLGGPGNDVLDGGFGDDTYVFGRGSGQDTINDRDWQLPNTDRLLMMPDVRPTDVTVHRLDDDLVLRIVGTTDEARLPGWFLEGFGADYQVQKVEFADGTVWDVAALKTKALAGTPGPDVLVGYGSADRIDGLDGDDTLIGAGGDDRLDGGLGADNLQGGTGNDTLVGGPGVDRLSGGDQNDTLDGGSGNDVLDGGFGDDTYVFGRGSGQDTINDRDWQIPNTDRILMASDVRSADVTVHRLDNDLALRIVGTTDEARLPGWFLEGFGADYQVQKVEFADGTVWDVAGLKQLASSLQGTGGADTLVGTGAADTIRGLAGDDALWGRDGDDFLDGGPGADTAAGEAGNDTYIVEDAGDRIIEGPSQGTDTIRSAVSYTLPANVERLTLTGTAPNTAVGNGLANVLAGNGAANSLVGGAGNDTYLFGRGSGADTIVDSDSTPGNADVLLCAADIRPIDLVLGASKGNLKVSLHGTPDSATVNGWYFGPAQRVETIQAGDGSRLLDSRVALLIQDMASYCAGVGLSWDQAIDRRPAEVQTILAAHWLPPA